MMFRKLAIAAAVLTLVGSTAIAAPAAAQDGPTLADILEAQGDGTDRNWYDFDILAAGSMRPV